MAVISCAWLLPSIRVTMRPIERHVEMFSQCLDRIGVLLIGIGIARPHDDATERPIPPPTGWQHGGHQRRALAIAQGEEEWHLALDVGGLADILLDEHRGQRLETFRRLLHSRRKYFSTAWRMTSDSITASPSLTRR